MKHQTDNPSPGAVTRGKLVTSSHKRGEVRYTISVADPEGVQANPPWRPNYFIFMGSFKKIMRNQQNETPFLNLNPLSRNPGSAPVSSDSSEEDIKDSGRSFHSLKSICPYFGKYRSLSLGRSYTYRNLY